MKKTKFISIEADNCGHVVIGSIKNDYEQQLDADYHQMFKEDRPDDIPTQYEVTVTVKKIGKL